MERFLKHRCEMSRSFKKNMINPSDAPVKNERPKRRHNERDMLKRAVAYNDEDMFETLSHEEDYGS